MLSTPGKEYKRSGRRNHQKKFLFIKSELENRRHLKRPVAGCLTRETWMKHPERSPLIFNTSVGWRGFNFLQRSVAVLFLCLEKTFLSQTVLLYAKIKDHPARTSLVAQWLRIRLPMQGTRVQALVREGPTCHGGTKPVRHSYWAWALEPASHNYWSLHALGPVIHKKRSHLNEKTTHCNEE